MKMVCASCKRPVLESNPLKAINCYWHETCLKCTCCDRQLFELGSTLYFRDAMTLCRNCYLRLYGRYGICESCATVIDTPEWIMRVNDTVYHLKCFSCHKCNGRFCVGERFVKDQGKIYCAHDCEI